MNWGSHLNWGTILCYFSLQWEKQFWDRAALLNISFLLLSVHLHLLIFKIDTHHVKLHYILSLTILPSCFPYDIKDSRFGSSSDLEVKEGPKT